MKKGKNILIIILIIVAFVGIVILTYKMFDKQYKTSTNKEYELNGFIIKQVDIQEENSNECENTAEPNMLEGVLTESEEETSLEYENSIIGTIEIPKLELEAPIKEGTDLEILAQYVGHFSNSNVWDGNVVLAAHNRGTSVKHYFDRINELVNGDTIIYKTKLGERSYEVISSKEIENTDWSVTQSNTNENNTIILITCIRNQPEKRLCVIAEEKN